jgi:DNA-binding PadR family transcriptional regulator
MSPVFAHGQLRLYLLALLDEEPRHGYDVIRALEERFSGMYTPSAGTVYPRLARLEEEGMVRRSETGRKSVYEITDAGRAELLARHAELAALQSELDDSVAELARAVRQQVKGTARSLKAELSAAARSARREAVESGRGAVVDAHWAASALIRDVEMAVTQLRADVRALVRRRGIDDQVVAAAREAVEAARTAIRELTRERDER